VRSALYNPSQFQLIFFKSNFSNIPRRNGNGH
jgi:hypothetical protein